jgi:hypothetical protein
MDGAFISFERENNDASGYLCRVKREGPLDSYTSLGDLQRQRDNL